MRKPGVLEVLEGPPAARETPPHLQRLRGEVPMTFSDWVDVLFLSAAAFAAVAMIHTER